jgi:hypothetical protein
MWQQNMPYCCRSISGGVGREDGLVVLVDLSQPLPTPAPARTRQRTDGDILAVVGDQREVGNLQAQLSKSHGVRRTSSLQSQ